jgi:hypothetical protein
MLRAIDRIKFASSTLSSFKYLFTNQKKETMKTKNLFLIVALLSIATLTFSQTQTADNHVSAKISLASALHNPLLVKAMHEQLSLTEVLGNNDDANLYYGIVKVRGIKVAIFGTREEWIAFFEVSYEDVTPES